jgi:HlyD family secretion protein
MVRDIRLPFLLALSVLVGAGLSACRSDTPADRVRVSGHVEATEVQVSTQVGGHLVDLRVAEGDRVVAGDLVAHLDTRDSELALERARAERQQADAQLRLLRAGSRPEDIRQAAAQYQAANAEVAAAEADLVAADADLARFEALLQSNAGSRKQRDDALARRDVTRGRVLAARERARAAEETLARVRAGARPEEIDAAAARLAIANAEIATLEKRVADATVSAPSAGIVTEKLAERGELLAPRTPVVVITDLDHAWADVFVDEPAVPRLRLGQPATLYTDAGGDGIAGKVTFISPQAEFTPRNVQTAEDRSRLVYRVKVSVDNRKGVLKQGMPVEAELRLQ